MNDKIKNFFGLKTMPFSKPMPTSRLFPTRAIKDISSCMEIALKNEDFALITGAAGSGKSSALRYFISQIDPLVFPHVYITAENYKIGDVAKLFLAGLNITPPFHGYYALRKLKDEVKRMYTEKNCKPVFIIDEAQDLPLTTLSSVKNLTNFRMDSESMMLVVLCGQYELVSRIKSIQLESLRRRIRIQYKIEPMQLEECMQYITFHMKLAGIDRKIFSDELVAEIYRISQGQMSNVNNICFELLLCAVRESKEIIDISLLEKIILPA